MICEFHYLELSDSFFDIYSHFRRLFITDKHTTIYNKPNLYIKATAPHIFVYSYFYLLWNGINHPKYIRIEYVLFRIYRIIKKHILFATKNVLSCILMIYFGKYKLF